MKGYQAEALAFVLLAIASLPAHANLVADPGFESCTSNSESPPPDWGSTTARCSDSNPHSGSWSAVIDNPNGTTLTQFIPTIAGDTYDFSFWLENTSTAADHFFDASIGSSFVMPLPRVLHLVNPPDFDYTFEDFTVTAASVSTTIEFAAAGSGLGSGRGWFLDDVSVTPLQTAVPEPPSLALFAAGLLALAAVRRRRLGKLAKPAGTAAAHGLPEIVDF